MNAALQAVAAGQWDRPGLTITSYFTMPGVHPYDELEWELRDAVIKDWKTGKIAFEQRDVEFPKAWSLNATTIVAQKYFRGHLGTPSREHSVRQMIDRVADTITAWGRKDGYFANAESADAFNADLKHLLVHQKAAFNSPVWFNVGVKGRNPQCSACFILSVEDTMGSILNWYVEEGMIFKGGSGSGVNLSRIRSSVESLAGGGTASGPVSFMRGADASAGTIKSGGTTRRAAKMVILNIDHPDIEEFIWCKQREELKARALREAGFDMDLDGRDSASIQYQNANNSVRVTDEFMNAVLADEEFILRAVTTGEPVKTIRARDLMRQIAQAAWECADPGMQYDTTINDWHTTPNAGRINGSNPCFPGDARVHTDQGLIRFDELVERVQDGEAFAVYTHDATNVDAPTDQVELSSPDAFMITGHNPIVRLRFSNGMELRCTPNHPIFTVNRGFIPAEGLRLDDQIKVVNLPTPAVAADLAVPVPTAAHAYQKDDRRDLVRLPEKWTPEFAEYLGWLVSDGCVSDNEVTTIYESAEAQTHILPEHQAFMTWMNGDQRPMPSVQADGTFRLHQSSHVVTRFLEALGVVQGTSAAKVVPWSVMQAPPEIAAAFLRGLFDAAGWVHDGKQHRYVGLDAQSSELLRGVQILLKSLGIDSCICAHAVDADQTSFADEHEDHTTVSYGPRDVTDNLRIASPALEQFALRVNFSLPLKAEGLTRMLNEHAWYPTDETVRLVERTDDGFELTYNLSEPRNHSYIVNGIVVRNCSEYMHLDNSACNLASLNLCKFEANGVFDTEAFCRAVEIIFTAQEIIVGNSSYPTKKIEANAHAYRQLGLGYANLGGLLMRLGLAYDSDKGRAWAAAITALMTGHAYRTSAEIARVVGPFEGYAKDRDGMLRILRKHRAAVEDIDVRLAPANILNAARQAWDDAVTLGTEHGVRNAQASVLAPTGCLVGSSLIATDRGLVRIQTLAEPSGPQWQDLDMRVATDEGPRSATQFYVNGFESVVTVETSCGYQIQGTPAHKIKVITVDGCWQWKRFGDLAPGDTVPLLLDQRVGQAQQITLPALGEPYWTDEHHARAPRAITPELAELVGYFMSDGSLHARGLRLRAAEGDFDVIEHLVRLAKELFGLDAHVSEQPEYAEVTVDSIRLAEWWQACGFGKREPASESSDKGEVPYIPDAVLYSNDRAVYTAFLRGLFEAGRTVTTEHPHWSTTWLDFGHDVQALLLALGYPTTRRLDTTGRDQSDLSVPRPINSSYHEAWLAEIGFLPDQNATVQVTSNQQAAWHDNIPLTRTLVDRLAPADDRMYEALLRGIDQTGSASRRLVTELYQQTGDREVGHLLKFFYDTVAFVCLGDEDLTYDLSVPDNVTYVANGFISHNTIGLMMDCDTTGIEPDLGLVKSKKLVGGGTMRIVNQTVPVALTRLGYQTEQIEAIVMYIDEHGTIEGAPAFKPEHLPVFDCAIGKRSILPMGHIKMMAAVQPWVSGAISKTCNLPESATVKDIERLYIEGWQRGLKAIAIYRDNCKVAQPLSLATKKETPNTTEQAAAKAGMVRRRLPKQRPSQTISFQVGDAEGYLTAGEYPGDGLGEIFVKLGKQGSTLAGVMDAFAISVSIGLQYGVPLEVYVRKFTNMRFEPAGMTDDPEVRFATSIVDYLFRRLAIEYLPTDRRQELGIYTMEERAALDSGLPASQPPSVLLSDATRAPTDQPTPVDDTHGDAPMCYQCGVAMIRAGSCHCCPQCGMTSGCS
jgi:ribonucleoside-diphosphate reductase alpha chain